LNHKHSEIQVWQPAVTCMMSSTTKQKLRPAARS